MDNKEKNTAEIKEAMSLALKEKDKIIQMLAGKDPWPALLFLINYLAMLNAFWNEMPAELKKGIPTLENLTAQYGEATRKAMEAFQKESKASGE